ncbi:HepT-like ribonuclease domain-containing protein [Ursidibacter arcticus]
MKRMCNIIAHGYFELDFDIVWEIVQNSIPELLVQIEELIVK